MRPFRPNAAVCAAVEEQLMRFRQPVGGSGRTWPFFRRWLEPVVAGRVAIAHQGPVPRWTDQDAEALEPPVANIVCSLAMLDARYAAVCEIASGHPRAGCRRCGEGVRRRSARRLEADDGDAPSHALRQGSARTRRLLDRPGLPLGKFEASTAESGLAAVRVAARHARMARRTVRACTNEWGNLR